MADPLTVVVPTRDRPVMLDGCLASIRRTLRPIDELLVVDSASSDPQAVAAVAARHDGRLLRCDRPGASRARNSGWWAARNDIVAFVDDDVVVSAEWAPALAEVFERHPVVSFVTGRLTPPAGQEHVERPVAVKDGATPGLITRATPGPLGHGANMACRRALLEELGGFDERLGAGAPLRAAEDNDLFDRALAAGRVGWYAPGVRAFHLQWRDKRALLRLDWSYGIGGGARLAKLLRADRGRARQAARTYLWTWGLLPFARDVRAGYEFGAFGTACRLAGTAVGFVVGLVVVIVTRPPTRARPPGTPSPSPLRRPPGCARP